MLTEYIQTAMSHASIEAMEEGGYFAHIPQLQGPWGDGTTEAECLANLRQTLEEWLLLALRDDDELPVIDGASLNFGGKRWPRRLVAAS